MKTMKILRESCCGYDLEAGVAGFACLTGSLNFIFLWVNLWFAWYLRAGIGLISVIVDFVASGAAMFEFQAGFVFWEAWTSMHMIVLVIRIYVGSDAIQDYVEGNARVLKGWETGTGNHVSDFWFFFVLDLLFLTIYCFFWVYVVSLHCYFIDEEEKLELAEETLSAVTELQRRKNMAMMEKNKEIEERILAKQNAPSQHHFLSLSPGSNMMSLPSLDEPQSLGPSVIIQTKNGPIQISRIQTSATPSSTKIIHTANGPISVRTNKSESPRSPSQLSPITVTTPGTVTPSPPNIYLSPLSPAARSPTPKFLSLKKEDYYNNDDDLYFKFP